MTRKIIRQITHLLESRKQKIARNYILICVYACRVVEGLLKITSLTSLGREYTGSVVVIVLEEPLVA